MLTDSQAIFREMVLPALRRGATQVPINGIVPKFSRTPGWVTATGPALGEHIRQVLQEVAGLTAEQIDDLTGDGIV